MNERYEQLVLSSVTAIEMYVLSFFLMNTIENLRYKGSDWLGFHTKIQLIISH
jgi:hypothetical protein